MSFSKTQIYNISLSSLLLYRQIVDAETDKSNEVSVLNTFWDVALTSTLADLDLDSTSEDVALELLVELTDNVLWGYVYKYPSNCSFLRKINSSLECDTKNTFIDKKIAMYQGQKAIFTNEYQAIASCILKNYPLEFLTPMGAMAIAYRLAILASPLIVGKGADKLIARLENQYVLSKSEAQKNDSNENFKFEDDSTISEFVEVRLS